MAEIRLSRIKSSVFKISSYAGPSVSPYLAMNLKKKNNKPFDVYTHVLLKVQKEVSLDISLV